MIGKTFSYDRINSLIRQFFDAYRKVLRGYMCLILSSYFGLLGAVFVWIWIFSALGANTYKTVLILLYLGLKISFCRRFLYILLRRPLCHPTSSINTGRHNRYVLLSMHHDQSEPYLCNRLFELCKALYITVEDRSLNHYLLHFITHKAVHSQLLRPK